MLYHIVQVGVELTNSFSGLEVEGGAGGHELEDDSRERPMMRDEKHLWGRAKSSGKVLLVGDSIVRYVDREFCKGNKNKRTRICLSGAHIENVSRRVNSMIEDEEVVVVAVGTNNMGSGESSELIRAKYRELLMRLKSTRAKVVCCGVLPRYDGKVSRGKMIDFNGWLAKECGHEDFVYVDMWEHFVGKLDYFAKDGLHISSRGAYKFGRLINQAIKGLSLN